MKQMICLFMFLFLIACGGGGGSSSGDESTPDDKTPEQTTEVQRISLTGLAVKGLAKKAKVSAYTQSGSAFKTTADVSTVTNSEGRYTIRLPESLAQYTGPLKIVLSYNDAESKLECDDNDGCGVGINFGDFYDMPQDFELASVVNVGSGLTNANGETIANISALTTLATNYLERGEISASALKQSNNQIRAVFSLAKTVDLVSTQPTVVSNESSKGDAVYGAINAAFLKVANNLDSDLNTLLDDYSSELIDRNGQIFQKAPEGDSDAPSILAIATAAEALGVLTEDDLETVTTVKNAANAAAAGTVTDITPPSISAGNDQSVNAGATVAIPVTLLLPNSFDELSNEVFLWQVISGPLSLVGNSSTTTNNLTFTAPAEGGDIKLRIIIESDEGSDNDIVIIKVKPALTGDTAKSGTYQISGLERKFFGGGNNLKFEYELFFDTLNATFNTNGTGALLGAAANASEFYESQADLSTVETLVLEPREFTVGTIGIDDEFTVAFSQLSTGSVQINLPVEYSEEIDDVSGNGFVEKTEARSFKLFDVGAGLYAGFNMAYYTEYQVTNNVRAADANAHATGFDFLSLSKNNAALSNFAPLANKAYTGVELLTIVSDTNNQFNMKASKGTMTFNADGSSFEVAKTRQELTGIPNTNQKGDNVSYQLTEAIESPGANNSTNFSMVNGRFTLGLGGTPAGAIIYNAVASDFTAITSSGYAYENDSGTQFNVATALQEELWGGLFIEQPTSTIDVNNKVFNIKFINYLVENPDTTLNSVAPEIILEQYVGTMTITDGDIKLDLQLSQSKLTYPDGTVGASSVNAKISNDDEPETINAAFEISTTSTDADGCVSELNGNFEFCISDNGTIVGWNYGTDVEGTFSSHSVGMFMGKQKGAYTSSGFTKVDLEGNTFNLAFTDGPGLYEFTAGGTGNVTFPGSTIEPMDWSIDGSGRIIMTLADETDRYTLTSGTAASGTITLEIKGANDLDYQVISEETDKAWTQN